jgi:hypothetical protein
VHSFSSGFESKYSEFTKAIAQVILVSAIDQQAAKEITIRSSSLNFQSKGGTCND